MSQLANPSRKSLSGLPILYLSSMDRYTTRNGLLYSTAIADNTPRVVVIDNNDLWLLIMFICHYAPSGVHRVREKTYLTVSRDFYWPRQYQIGRKYIRACEVCQRVKPSTSFRAPLQPLPVPK